MGRSIDYGQVRLQRCKLRPIPRMMSPLISFSCSVLTRPEHISAVFRDSDRHSKAENNNSGYLMSQILGRCLGLISRDDWKRVRSITEQPFHRSTTAAYLPLISRRTRSYFRELWETSDLSRGLLHPAEDLKLLPFLMVAEIIYGSPLAPEVEKELRALAPQREAFFNKHVMAGGLGRFSWSKFLPTRANRELAAFQERWLAFNTLAHRHALQEHPSAPIVSFFQALDAGQLSAAELLHTLDEMLYANLDVTAGGMSWSIVFLAAQRDVQARLRAEIAGAKDQYNNKASTSASTSTALDPESLPAAYLLSPSTFLAACINESARLRPLAAFSVPQSTPTPRVVGGYSFPAGTHFVVDAYALNVRNGYWGPDAADYKPERFLGREAVGTRYQFWRFGFGPRVCLGRYVADLVIRAVLAELVGGWEVSVKGKEVGEWEVSVKGKEVGEWERDGGVWIDQPDFRVGCVRREKAEEEEGGL